MKKKIQINRVKNNFSRDSVVGTMQENLPSLILGFFIFVLFLIGITKFIKEYKNDKEDTSSIVVTKNSNSPENTDKIMKQQNKMTPDENAKIGVDTYTVKEGDSLWSIAEMHFNSGEKAYDLAQANNIVDPNSIEVGQKIALSKVTNKESSGDISSISTGEVTVHSDTYTIGSGDTLWNIAIKTYGDGYMWTRLADANQISNPNLIYEGNSITIPRNNLGADKQKGDSTMTYTPNY